MLEGGLRAVQADEDVVGTSRVRELERRVRQQERLLGRKTMEVEILKEALDVARVKRPSLQLPSSGQQIAFPMTRDRSVFYRCRSLADRY